MPPTASPSKEELDVRKQLKAAQRDLHTLRRQIHDATKKLSKGQGDASRAKNASKRILDFMSKYRTITKVQSSKLFSSFDSRLQDEVLRMDAVYNELLKHISALKKSAKFVNIKPRNPKDLVILIESGIQPTAKIYKPPQGFGQVLKTLKQATMPEKYGDFEFQPSAGLGVLPMLIILAYIGEMIRKKIK